MTEKQTDIVISGGGIAGLTLAILLGQAGLRVAVIEPFPPPAFEDVRPSGRTIALMNASLNIVRACTGVWDRVEPYACEMEGMRIVDVSRAVEDPVEIEFPASGIDEEQFGYNIPNTVLRTALYEVAVRQDRLEIFTDALDDYEAGTANITAHLKHGRRLQASLIVGADGRRSKVREIAGIGIQEMPYDQAALTFLVSHSHPHENVSTEFHKPHGPLAFVPLPGGHQSSVVWVERKERAEELCRQDKAALAQDLTERAGDFFGKIRLETEPESWPLCSILARSLVAPRVALIAEAAHVMSPITAQGLNLSLRDVAALAESIVDAARLGLDIGGTQVLRSYEKRRRLDVQTRVFGVDTLNRLVGTKSRPLKDLRRVGLKTLETVPPLKVLSMRMGLAPDPDPGRLARGEAL